MATVTRSTRRTEAPTVHPLHAAPNPHPHLIAGFVAQNRQSLLQNHIASRSKRPLGGPERDFGALGQKRTRFSADYPLKPPRRDAPPPPKVTPVPLARPPVVAPAPPARAVAAAATAAPATAAAPAPRPPSRQAQPATHDDDASQHPNLTKHQEKVINGIKHELHRLQPSDADTREQGRKLRSQEASRFKSELSAYFPDYDEVIGNDPKEERTCFFASWSTQFAFYIYSIY